MMVGIIVVIAVLAVLFSPLIKAPATVRRTLSCFAPMPTPGRSNRPLALWQRGNSGAHFAWLSKLAY
jgi:hypothetical protein